MPPRKRLFLPAVTALLIAVLTGCSSTVALDPALDATNPGCAEIIVRLPNTLADLPLRETNAQATAAWGSPAAVLLRCGIEPSGPTTLPCVNVSGVDWIQDDSNAPSNRFVTFGRVPATEVIVDSNVVSASTVLIDLQKAISALPATKECLAAG